MSQGAVGKEWVGVMAKPVVFFGALFGPAPWCPLGSGSLSAPVGSGFFGALVVLVPWVPLRVPLLLALREFRPLGVRWVPVPCAPLSVASHSAAEEALPWLSRVLRPPRDTVFPVVAGQTPSLRTRWPSLAPPVCQKGFFCYRGAAGWPFAFELIKATWSQYSGSRTLARLVASASGRSHLLRHIS